jgi:DNA polymerase-3 subunit delta'
MKNIIFNLVEFYFRKLNLSVSKKIFEKYSYFLKKISDTKNFNLDEESLFMEFEEQILDG